MNSRLIPIFVILLTTPALARACTVCFGDPNSPLTTSVGWGIWVMIGFIGVVLALFGLLFLNIRRRMKRISLVK